MIGKQNSTPAGHYLAVDIGASSGRHLLGCIEGGCIRLREVYRFPNGMTEQNGSLCWDIDLLVEEILRGMSECAANGIVPASIGIDTWGVDYVLLGKAGKPAAPAIGYRDKRTEGMQAEVFKRISGAELYSRTGIQDVVFNTIYQLMAVRLNTPEHFENAECLLLMPDYLRYRLTGKKATEYTIASTTGLLGAASKTWDFDVIERCAFPRKLFCDIVPPGTRLGNLSDTIKKAVGYDCEVILPPSHDTASAFLAVPAASSNCIYISSGTWSIMGVELDEPVTSEQSRMANFSNEGGYDYRYRYLKNIMGLWMVQSVRRELGSRISFGELEKQARASSYPGLVDVDDNRFFAPANMTAAIREVCAENGFASPETPGDLARCIYRSLALSYSKTVKELETLTGKKYDSINIIGGGSQNALLNELTAAQCGIPVYAGPAEGTALGNIVSQMIAAGELSGAEQAREMIRRSFEVKKYS